MFEAPGGVAAPKVGDALFEAPAPKVGDALFEAPANPFNSPPTEGDTATKPPVVVAEKPPAVVVEKPPAVVAEKKGFIKPEESLILPKEEIKGTMAAFKEVTKKLGLVPRKPALMEEDGRILPGNIALKSGAKISVEGYYVPRTSSSFPNFLQVAFLQYSPYLTSVLADKKIDQDACKKRDPNKVQGFYYQDFVRDYMSNGSPSRGILVYHGLGTGKTCGSIAAAEALYWGGQKTIFVLTPATLSNNYRKDLGKCGFYPLRIHNEWQFLQYDPANAHLLPQQTIMVFLRETVGLPEDLIVAQRGGWIANPDKPSNWDTLSDDMKAAIRKQQEIHLNHRFKFIHYNGVTKKTLTDEILNGVEAGKSIFDNAVVIVDEVHNLVRTINGSMISGKPIAAVISGKAETSEPREPTWSAPLARETNGYYYPRGYSLYRLIQNAVGIKFIALSATPMINYAQELAILMNMIGGEQRMVEITLKGVSLPGMASIKEWASKHTEIDFWKIEEAGGKTVLNVTPVPYGFQKIVDPANFAVRGFVRLVRPGLIKESKERNMDKWAMKLIKELVEAKILGVTPAEMDAAQKEIERIRDPGEIKKIKGPLIPVTPLFKLHTFPLLPEDADDFVKTFINRANLSIFYPQVLKARMLGLVSYYKGGSEELMPRVGENKVIRVEMSDYMFKEYIKIRQDEIASSGSKPDEKGGEVKAPERKHGTRAERDLYDQATKTVSTAFLAFSRAACNWVFPEGVKRPQLTKAQQLLLAGDYAEEGVLIRKQARAAKAERAEEAELARLRAAEEDGEDVELIFDTEEMPDEDDDDELDEKIMATVRTAMTELEADSSKYLKDDLPQNSPKYATIIQKIRESPGPALVYSNWKTLEGLGIFSAALRASAEQYLPLDIVQEDGDWIIPEAFMAPERRHRPRYIIYSGDESQEKRKLLLQLYNADLVNLPPFLKLQCEDLLEGEEDNRNGKVCKVFMITQSGAEGISLFNTRQVHIMEPYWNNVRLQQVIGRAIRLCSHMNLDWEDRVVDVYTYLSVFSSKQKLDGGAGLIMRTDKTETTDEIIYKLAVAKQTLADNLSELAQGAAADCVIHHNEHGRKTKCFTYPEGFDRPMFMYHPDWQKDVLAGRR